MASKEITLHLGLVVRTRLMRIYVAWLKLLRACGKTIDADVEADRMARWFTYPTVDGKRIDS